MDSSELDSRRLARGAGYSVVGKFTGSFIGFAGDIVAARILGPTFFGLYAIGWTLVSILGLVAPLGLDSGVVRYIPRLMLQDQVAVKNLIGRSVALVGLCGAILAAALYVSAPWLAQAVYHKSLLTGVFRLLALAVPFIVLLTVTAAITRSTGDMKYSVMLEDIGQPLLGLSLLLAFYLSSGLNVTAVILAQVISFAAMSLLALWTARHVFAAILQLPGGSNFRFSEVLAYSVPTAAAGALSVLVFWVDRLLVGYYLPARETGLYQAASQLSLVFVLILAGFNSILAPIYADLHARKNIPEMQEMFRVGTKWGLYLSIPAFLVICQAPQQSLSVLFGTSYASAWAALLVLAVGQVVNLGTGSVGTLLIMTGHQHTWLRLSFVALLSNLVMCSLLIPRLGIVGAAVGTSVSLNAMYIVAIFRARALLGVWPYDRRYFKGIGAAAASTAVLVLMKALYGGSAPVFIALAIVLACGVFATVLYLFGPDPEDAAVFRLIREKLVNR